MISCLERPLSMSCTLLSLILCFVTVLSQDISTSTPLPPLQWINLSGLLSGSASAPPLKDASVGYDEVSRTLLVFGGESQQGFPQSQTYLLRLDTLQWEAPSPPPNLVSGPPPRSGAIGGDDVAASNRRSHIVIGGKDSSGQPLSDVWEFDYNNQFWSEVTLTPGGPSARSGAAGGIDTRTEPVNDLNLPGPNNTFYLAGGFDGKNTIPLSDIWRLNISGTLSANNPSSVVGSWQQIAIHDTIAGKTEMGGTVVLQNSQQRVVAVGGCTTSSPSNLSCADGDSTVINIDARGETSPSPCPAPRFGPAIAPNFNGGSSSFRSQVFMLLGTFNTSLWNDGNGLQRGEVAVLDVNTGAWARVLPAGDPGSTPSFPPPREGAAALSFGQQLVGSSRSRASDTIIFGGRDASGVYLNDVWILRSYTATLTQTNQSWSGFGDGKLRGGVDASGTGVTIQYMSQCASAINQPSVSASASASASGRASGTSHPVPTSTGSSNNTTSPAQASSPVNLYNTSVIHKTLAPLSVALLLPAVILFRLSVPSATAPGSSQHSVGLFYLSIMGATAAFGVGIGGLASSFTSITYTAPLAKRSSPSLNLQTNHGKAGLALFVGLYGLIPILLIATSGIHFWRGRDSDSLTARGRRRADSNDVAEKTGLYANRVGSPVPPSSNGLSDDAPAAESPVDGRRRVRSWNTLSPWPAHRNGRRSSESGVDGVSPPSTVRSFEVTNRPARMRHASAHSLAAFSDPRSNTSPQRNLSEMSWLDRRRSLNTVGELDYALTQIRRAPDPSTPGTAAMDMTSTRGLVVPSPSKLPRMPRAPEMILRLLLHAFLLGLCILSLIALWLRAPKAAFGVFLAWTALCYATIITLSWYGIPRESLLSVILSRLRGDHFPPPHPGPMSTPSPSRPLSSIGVESIPFPSGPYLHQPPVRAANEYDYSTSVGHGPGDVDDDDDEDEESRQRRIEDEMSRRDVSIVTVPRRRLIVTNPETGNLHSQTQTQTQAPALPPASSPTPDSL